MSEERQKTYDIQDVVSAGYTLEPIQCRFCQSPEVTYHQYIGDAYCNECGKWQLEEETK